MSAKKTSNKICIAGIKPNINLICEVIKGPKKIKGKDRGFFTLYQPVVSSPKAIDRFRRCFYPLN